MGGTVDYVQSALGTVGHRLDTPDALAFLDELRALGFEVRHADSHRRRSRLRPMTDTPRTEADPGEVIDELRRRLADDAVTLALFERHIADDRNAIGFALAANIEGIRLSRLRDD